MLIGAASGRQGDDIIPILAEDVPRVAARLGRVRAAQLPPICFRDLKGGRIKALSYYCAESAIRRAITNSGLRASKGLKGSHDFRRNATMKTLSASGNLRVTQRLLGRASIQSTLVYAHALGDDLKVALAQVSRNSPKRWKRSQITALSEPDHTILGHLRLLAPPCPHWSQSPIREGFESG